MRGYRRWWCNGWYWCVGGAWRFLVGALVCALVGALGGALGALHKGDDDF